MSDTVRPGWSHDTAIEDLARELRESEKRFDVLVNGTRDGVFMVDPSGRFLFVNDFIAESSGYPKEAFVGRHYRELIRPEDRDRVEENFQRALAGEKVEPYELAYRTATGGLMWVEINAARVHVDGETEGVLSISRNIQKRKEAEAALRESEEKYRTLIETLPHAVAIVQDERPVFVNDAARRLLGLDPVDESPRITQLVTRSQQSRVESLHQRRVAGEEGIPRQYRTTIRRADGTETPVEVLVRPLQYRGREAWHCVMIDLTERQALEMQLQHSQKMEAVGTLAGGIAHDFNNLLTGILGMAELLQRERRAEDPVRTSAEVIEQAARRAAHLIRQLLGFAHKSDVIRARVDVEDVVTEVSELLAHTVDKRIRIHRRFASGSSSTLGDPTQISQVLMNLAVNARDAMPDGGDLVFEVETVTLDDPGMLESFGLTSGPYVRVTVRDTGPGVPLDIRGRIFDPFFTTKPVGKGSGMGLAVAYGIVRSHHGAIRIESPPGSGTAMAVYLPPVPEGVEGESPPSLSAPAPDASTSPARGVVLLVDDEALVRRTTSQLLESLGYLVIPCADAPEAIEAARRRGPEIDVVLLDVSMPHMSGWACSSELRTIAPGLPVIMTSGRDPEAAADADRPPDVPFLPKPYSLGELAAALRAARRRR